MTRRVLRATGLSLPWGAAIVLYAAGIWSIHLRSAELTSDTARLGAMALQAILAAGVIHGLTRVSGVIRELGVAIDRGRGPEDER